MNKIIRTYLYMIVGAISGLIGWQASNLIGLSITKNVYLNEIPVGAVIGLVFGILLGALDGLLTRNWVKVLKGMLPGALLGLVAGAVALPLSEWVFQMVGAGLLGRMLGWGLFGLVIGLAAGMTGGTQLWKSVLGGLIGGVIGGALMELSATKLSDLLLGKAVGMILLGACIGVFTSLIVVLLARAWLEVKSGKLKGTEFILDKFIKARGPSIFIGSDALKSEIVLPDPDIAPQHAMLTGDGSTFEIKDMSLTGTFINNKQIERSGLNDRQTIKMGNTEMVYHEKR
ncbi:MAG: FHA domain-containing protein [Anaerolineaceae bacterium]|nr:FHA domain-containing protein [Anaerolineaceae bacterium]MBN2677927.1 FHA domain-containing protein [Anaerolineaceae bacterium]